MKKLIAICLSFCVPLMAKADSLVITGSTYTPVVIFTKNAHARQAQPTGPMTYEIPDTTLEQEASDFNILFRIAGEVRVFCRASTGSAWWVGHYKRTSTVQHIVVNVVQSGTPPNMSFVCQQS